MAKIYKTKKIARVPYLAFQNRTHQAIHNHLVLRIRDNHKNLLWDRETK